MGGYALAKFQFRLRGPATFLVLSSLIVPHSLLLAPGYQLLYELGLLDSYAGLILPGLVPAFGVFLFRQSMINSVPLELLEAARIDGCGEIRMFFQVVLPLEQLHRTADRPAITPEFSPGRRHRPAERTLFHQLRHAHGGNPDFHRPGDVSFPLVAEGIYLRPDRRCGQGVRF
jgi:hypothetical protein